MPEAQEKFQDSVNTALEVVMFESWLRFYFISEQDGEGDGPELVIDLPEKSQKRIKELYPRLYPLAERLNGRSIDFQISRDSVLAFIGEVYAAKGWDNNQAQQVLQSQAFQTRLNLFHTWQQLHENQLDKGFAEFGAWRDLFKKWLESPGAKELSEKLDAAKRAN